MGKYSLIPLALLILLSLSGRSASGTHQRDSVSVFILLQNTASPKQTIDSIYVIFDRFDHTGAGIIKQVYYPVNNSVKVMVPKGKYFIDVFCLGKYNNQHIDRIIKAKRRQTNKLVVKIENADVFTPGLVSIPPEKIDFSNLSVTRYASFH